MKNITSILKELTEKYLSKETLAGKMGVSTRTIDRWQKSLSKPSYAERKLLNQIYNGYKNVSKQKET
uniref:Putative DNA binding, helix-turn-helix domain containing protein n=1 Tax=viral metagenome TaxID=1070528 RepID=A0A6H2A647_9ZZZZ